MKGFHVFNQGRGIGFGFLLIICVFLQLIFPIAGANVVLIGNKNNVTLSFEALIAGLGVPVGKPGEYGLLYLATPIDACSPLVNPIDPIHVEKSPYVLIERGYCNFDEKVRRAQTAGYKAAIIYNNAYDSNLVSMGGSSAGIKIHAVFISRASGEVLKKFVGDSKVSIWLMPDIKNSEWSIISILLNLLLVISVAVPVGCFFFFRHCSRRGDRPRPLMSSRSLKALPSLIFRKVSEDNSTSGTCAICIEDYSVGEKIRVLPCGHKFHAACVDSWLTSWKTFCPVCKRDAKKKKTGKPAAAENTPLLSSTPESSTSSTQSSVASSSVQISQTPAQIGISVT